MDLLGHWLTPSGVKPCRKKVDAIHHLQPPTNDKQLRSFLVMVNYYHDMWPCHTHVLAPLTALTGKRSFIWTTEFQQAFDQMKALVSSDVPSHSLTICSPWMLKWMLVNTSWVPSLNNMVAMLPTTPIC